MTNEEKIIELLNQLHLKIDSLEKEVHASRKEAKKAKKAVKALGKALGQPDAEEDDSDDK